MRNMCILAPMNDLIILFNIISLAKIFRYLTN